MFGILSGKPGRPLIPAWFATGELLAAWIEGEIPCTVGSISRDYTNAILMVFVRSHVPAAIQREAFLILDKKGVTFAGLPAALMPAMPAGAAARPAPQMQAIGKEYKAATVRHTISQYERKYVLALRTQDVAGAQQILTAVLKLLWDMAQGYADIRKDARHEMVGEWAEFNLAVNQALENAQMLRTHVRYLTREQITEMRRSPSPSTMNDLAARLARQLTVRTIPRPQRARR